MRTATSSTLSDMRSARPRAFSAMISAALSGLFNWLAYPKGVYIVSKPNNLEWLKFALVEAFDKGYEASKSISGLADEHYIEHQEVMIKTASAAITAKLESIEQEAYERGRIDANPPLYRRKEDTAKGQPPFNVEGKG